MNLEVGSVVTGKVTGIAKFGAFVSLAPDVSGLVHISEVADSYISSVEDYLKVGQEVRVKVISVDANNRIYLSIKQAAEGAQHRSERPRMPSRSREDQNGRVRRQPNNSAAGDRQYQDRRKSDEQTRAAFGGETVKPKSDNQAFEDTLKKFLQEADSKISECGRYERQRSSRKRNGRH